MQETSSTSNYIKTLTVEHITREGMNRIREKGIVVPSAFSSGERIISSINVAIRREDNLLQVTNLDAIRIGSGMKSFGDAGSGLIIDEVLLDNRGRIKEPGLSFSVPRSPDAINAGTIGHLMHLPVSRLSVIAETLKKGSVVDLAKFRMAQKTLARREAELWTPDQERRKGRRR